MNIQYKTLDQIDNFYAKYGSLSHWAYVRETDEVVALAIHAISDKNRSANEIWEAPTPAEWDTVLMAVQNYVDNDLYEPQDSYQWGLESFML